MSEAHIGRLLAACLHQAIADRLPQRLEFYEHWLNSEDLRDGSIGLAPLAGVVGFLRTEGSGYEDVMSRAGELAAAWSIANIAPFRRRVLGWLPRPLRIRAALRIAAGIVRDVSSASRASVRVGRGRARLQIDGSPFCAVRGPSTFPLCVFYAALAVETLRHFAIGATGGVDACRGMGGSSCAIVIELSGTVAAEPAIAA